MSTKFSAYAADFHLIINLKKNKFIHLFEKYFFFCNYSGPSISHTKYKQLHNFQKKGVVNVPQQQT